jgi:CHAT domain-containing protein
VQKQGEATLVVIRSFAFVDTGYLLLRLEADESSPVSYFHSGGAGSMKHSFVALGRSAPALVVTRSVTTGHYLGLWIFDPNRPRVLQIYPQGKDEDGVYHGGFQFLDFDQDGRPEVQITYATDDRRYESCNQCPVRRASEIWGISPDLGSARLLGFHTSWSDFSVATSRTLFGLGPEVGLGSQATALAKALADLPHLSLPLSELRKHVESMNNDVGGYIGVGDYANAAKAFIANAAAIAAHPQAKDLQDLRGVALFNGMRASLMAGQVDAAAHELAEIDRSGIRFQDETIERIELTRFDLARRRGDLRLAFQVLERLRQLKQFQGEAAFREAGYLLEIGDNPGVVATATRGEQLDGFTSSDVHQEMLWQRAVALVNLGRFETAVDELLRLARFAANSSAGEMLSKVYLLGARIAFTTRHFEAGRYLLDASVSHMPADFWKSEAPLILSLYATYHDASGRTATARRFLNTAVRAAQELGGVRLAVPYDQLAAIAERNGDAAGARAASIASLSALLGQQAKVATEQHKLSFVGSADRIAAGQLARLINTKADVAILFSALESWRSQVLRSIVKDARVNEQPTFEPSAIVGFVQSRLPRHTALVSYAGGKDGELAFVLDTRGLRQVPLGHLASRLEAIRARLLGQLDPNSNKGTEADIAADRVPPGMLDDLQQLYSNLIAPLNLDPQITEIVIVPDERLFWIPWAAVSRPPARASQGSAPGVKAGIRPLLADFSVRVLPSALLVAEPRPADLRRALLVGSTLGVGTSTLRQAMPSMKGIEDGVPMPPLPNVAKELEAITTSLRTSAIALDALLIHEERQADQLPQLLNNKLSGSSVVHIAGHGLFDAFDPMASAMLLGGANPNGLVRAADLAAHDMTRVELVALSGCETALAVVRPGQEALGFVRGVLAAGARRILLTQWQVDDAATAYWFKEYYQRLGQGTAPEQAYRETVLTMASRYQHPYYWAGLTLYAR